MKDIITGTLFTLAGTLIALAMVAFHLDRYGIGVTGLLGAFVLSYFGYGRMEKRS